MLQMIRKFMCLYLSPVVTLFMYWYYYKFDLLKLTSNLPRRQNCKSLDLGVQIFSKSLLNTH